MISIGGPAASRRVTVCIFIAVSVILLFGVYSVLPTWSLPHSEKVKSPYLKARTASHWHSWHSIEHLIVFGDSWSSTGFDVDAEAPSTSNPLGNPAFPGATVTNGANWIDYLTYTYNESIILTVDLAVGGATVDTKLIKPGLPEFTLRSLKKQVEDVWKTHEWNWTADSSLFTIWMGVNDVTAYTEETKDNFGKEFVIFADLMDQVYVSGARNFLLMNLAPVDKSPFFKNFGAPEWPSLIDQWNANVTALSQNFTTTYSDTTMFFFDAWQLFNDVIEDPCLFKESCGFEVTTEACLGYYYGATTPDYKSPDCPYSVDKYLWINELHVSSRMHKTIARAVYDALAEG